MAKKNEPQDALAPTPHPEVLAGATGQETVDEKLAKLDKELTQRINELRTQIGAIENAADGRLDDAEKAIRNLQTTAANNADTIRSFAADVDQVKKIAAQLRTAESGLENEVKQAIAAQDAKNAEFATGIAAANDLALEASTAAAQLAHEAEQRSTERLNKAREELNQRIKAVEDAPVKPHVHSFHVDGTTGSVVQNGGKP